VKLVKKKEKKINSEKIKEDKNLKKISYLVIRKSNLSSIDLNIISIDGFWKSFKKISNFKDESSKIIRRGFLKRNGTKVESRYPVYYFGGMKRDSNIFVPFAFTFSRYMTGKLLAQAMKLIRININKIVNESKELKKIYNVEKHKKFESKPLIVIDDGTREKKMCRLENLDYLLCRFHILKTWKENSRRIFSDENIKNKKKKNEKNEKLKKKLFKLLYGMMATFDSDSFLDAYSKFEKFVKKNKNKNPKLDKFKIYFDKVHKSEYSHWNLEKRKLNTGLLSTNNYMELFIRGVSSSLPGNRRFLKRMDDIFCFLVQSLTEMQTNDFYSTPVGKEFKITMNKAIEDVEEKKIKN
jgi:hypothetical protein